MPELRPVLQSGLARAGSFVPTAIATLLTSKLIISHYGIGPFDSFVLMTTLIALIPLNDLGVGAVITSSFAQSGPESEQSRRVMLTSVRVLLISAAGVIVAAVVLAAGGLWPHLLGGASGPNAMVAGGVCLFALSFLPGIGQRMLLGVSRNHVTILVQAFFTPLILLIVVLLVETGSGPDSLVLIPPLALVLISITTIIAATRVTRFRWRPIATRVFAPRRFPGVSIRATSGPMLVITLSAAFALQSDRIVLSHVSTDAQLARYSVVLQVFAPIGALVAASAYPLWPIWTKARSDGQRGPALGKVVLAFVGATTLVCAALVALADPIGDLIGGGRIDLGTLLPVVAALYMITQAVAIPVAMKLMYPAGVRFVAICGLIALPVNIALSIWFGQRWGAQGPLIASLAVGILIQTIPTVLYQRSQRVIGRHRRKPVMLAPIPFPGAAGVETVPMASTASIESRP